MKNILLVFLCVINCSVAIADDAIDAVTKPVLELIQKGEYKALATAAFPEKSRIREYISPADIKQLNTEMESYLRTMGKSYGYDLHHVSKIDGLFEIRYYLFRFERQPVIVKVGVYKPNKKWEFQEFSLDFNLDDYIEKFAEEAIGKSASVSNR
ncbi:hypothetical protein [Vibrio parahaemolyticus]|uniref:hypothetical protein n=1 Tax=Vibrio parahaemolyticus TaxID=670 RepID=UPI0011217397|nr:hypothetical protein [Vibrio parahaemolyticus]TNY75595.1 hypothetical protein CGK62_11685 [Vibrio parahaemolyticus]